MKSSKSLSFKHKGCISLSSPNKTCIINTKYLTKEAAKCYACSTHLSLSYLIISDKKVCISCGKIKCTGRLTTYKSIVPSTLYNMDVNIKYPPINQYH